MNRLAEIFDMKREEVGLAKKQVPLAAIREKAASAEPPRGFLRALKKSSKPLALIAEVKKASPSLGLIRADFDPVQIAMTYEAVGADTISVLTDERYFQGNPEDLEQVKAAVTIPCLRKDFIGDAYQVFQSRALGADAILLILAALDDALARDLMALSSGLGMDTLVEVHDLVEAERAMVLGADLVGVNNRSLHDFQTDVGVGERILPTIGNAFRVSESALSSKADLDRMQRAGAGGVLIGTAFCSSPNIEAKVLEVMGW